MINYSNKFGQSRQGTFCVSLQQTDERVSKNIAALVDVIIICCSKRSPPAKKKAKLIVIAVIVIVAKSIKLQLSVTVSVAIVVVVPLEGCCYRDGAVGSV